MVLWPIRTTTRLAPPPTQRAASRTSSSERTRPAGKHIGLYAERLFDRQFPWSVMRQGYQLLRLCDTYGAAKLNAVCERSLDFDVVDVPRIQRMLRMALIAESDAEERGKLRKLPQAPRFARDAGTYSTIESKREEDQWCRRHQRWSPSSAPRSRSCGRAR